MTYVQANASAKKTAAQNEDALRNLTRGMLTAPLLALLLRLLLGHSAVPSKISTVLHVLTAVPLVILYKHLYSIGSPRRDPITGALIGSGEDLNMSGITEWCWDIVYITWACQVGSALLGEWFWWLYLSVRAEVIKGNIGSVCRTDTSVRLMETLERIPWTLLSGKSQALSGDCGRQQCRCNQQKATEDEEAS